MQGQRNLFQMKKKNKTPEKELNEMKTSNLLDAEFTTLVIRMHNELGENFNSIKKDMESTEKNSVRNEKNILTEMKNNLQGTNNIVDEAENQISDLEYKEAKNTQSVQKKRKK